MFSKGIELLRDTKRTGGMGKFKEAEIANIVNDCTVLSQDVEKRLEETDTNTAQRFTVIVFHTTISRNKRCVLAYLMHRARTLTAYRWERPALTNKQRSKLHTAEVDFFDRYDKLLRDYGDQMDIDVLTDLEPPKDLMVEVRATSSLGNIALSTGVVDFKKGGTYLLKRSDAEPLIRSGDLEQA